MEKVVVLVWKPEAQTGTSFRQSLLGEVQDGLVAAGAGSLRLCVVDEDVAAASACRIESSNPVYDGMISFWVNSVFNIAALLARIDPHVDKLAAYLVTESEPILNVAHKAAIGERTTGMNQVVALQVPDRLTYDEWINTWLGSHTQIAIDLQSTFGYRQNVVTRSLRPEQPPYSAIVEENFPEAAMTSREAFYDAAGDEALYQSREKQMIESSMRFIDFDQIDCIPMSQYDLG